MANMASKVSGSLILTLHGSEAPTAPEWEAHLGLLAAAATSSRGSLKGHRSLVFSDGGMPDSAQRKSSTRVIEAAEGADMPIAILTTSTVVRGVVTAGHWFGLKMQAFSPAELTQATAFLGLGRLAQENLRRDLDALATMVKCRAYMEVKW